jgi:hypothetical protein
MNLPGKHTSWYGRAPPKDCTLGISFSDEWIEIIIHSKPIKQAVWLHRPTLNKLQEKHSIEKALDYFERQGS